MDTVLWIALAMVCRRLAACVVMLAGLGFLLTTGAARAQPEPLRMALIPYLSPSVLVPLFQPLARHLAKDVGRPVELYSAPSIRAHVDRILRPEYDIIFSAPHFGRLSQLDAGYVPIGSFERPLVGVITVKNDGPIRDISQLRGSTVAINDRLVLNSILTLAELGKRGIGIGDIRIVPAASQNSAILSVASGDVDAAITVNFAIGQIPQERQEEVRVLFRTDEIPAMPGTLILVHPAMPRKERERLQTSLMSFAGTDEGKRFLVTSNYKDVVKVTPAGLRNLDIYMPELRRLLAIKPGG